jgi:hypothetical protein
MRKVTYSRTLNSIEGQETFSAVEFDSFDEAKRLVDKGIHDRKLELEAKYPNANLASAKLAGPHTAASSMPAGATQQAPKVDNTPSTENGAPSTTPASTTGPAK